MLSLREYSQDLNEVNWSNRIKIGDVVLIKNTLKTIPHWLMGRVLNTHVDDDGKIRCIPLMGVDKEIKVQSICNYTLWNYLLCIAALEKRFKITKGLSNLKSSIEMQLKKNRQFFTKKQ